MKKYKLKQSYLKSSRPTLGNDLEKEERKEANMY